MWALHPEPNQSITKAMWLNQRTIDGLRVMAGLASRDPHMVKASELAEATTITLMNMQKTVNALGQAGLIHTTRGPRGGMRLAKPADRITISEIVRVFEPTDCPVHFLMMSEIDARIARLVFDAHRGFFRALENKTLLDVSTVLETV